MSERRTSMDPGAETIRVPSKAQRQHEKNHPPGTGDLFTPPALEATPPAPRERFEAWYASMRRDVERLAAEMLQEAGEHGTSFDIIRIAAETRGILTGEEEDRLLSFGAGLLKSLGGVATTYRPSKHRNANGRAIRVFVHRSFLPESRDP